MANKLKIYLILTILMIGLVFLGIGCAGNKGGSSTSANGTGSEGVPANQTTATGAQGVSVKGSDTVLPLAQAEAEEYLKENPGKSVSVTGGGSGVGIAALINGQVNIATASRDMTADEIKAAQAKGINPVKTVIAYDGIVVVVNPANPVSKLTFDQLRRMYTSNTSHGIGNWKDVGGEDKGIVTITRDSSSGTYADFKKDVLLGDELVAGLTEPSTGAIVTEVSQNPNTIGYIGFAYVDSSVKVLSLDKGKGSIPPTAESILDGSYPLSRTLQFYTNGEPSGSTKEFIDYVLSEKGQKIVSEVRYVPLKK